MKEPVLFNIQHFSVHDGPGIRTTVFFKGCPLRCAWCHNPEGQRFCPELGFSSEKCIMCGRCVSSCKAQAHAVGNGSHIIDRTRCIGCGACVRQCPCGALELLGKTWTLSEILSEIAKDDIFYGSDGGVTVSGGEPFAQPEALLTLLTESNKRGYSVCIETSGCAAPELIRQTVPFTDRYLFDCKETDEANHKRWTGVDLARVLTSLKVLEGSNAYVVLRCPIIPGVNDREDHMLGVAELMNTYSCIRSAELEPYHPLG